MSFNDVFKSSFLESITEFSIPDTIIGLAAALLLGLFIFLRRKHKLRLMFLYLGLVWWVPFPSSVSVPPSKSLWKSFSCSGHLLPAL